MMNAMKDTCVPADGDLRAWNERMNGSIGQSLPMRIEHVAKDLVVIRMDVTPRTHQPFGIMHGGVSVVLAESAASIGATVNAPRGMVAVGQEINANHLRPKSDGEVTATAVPLHIGRASQVWGIEIRDERGKLISVSRCTLANVEAP